MNNPYETLPPKAFWRSAVAEPAPRDIQGLWQPKREVMPDHRVVTFGSCFAQHFSRALVAQGYGWLDAEPAPAGLDEDGARARNYGVFSARTGNIYTSALLRQWLQWSLESRTVPEEIWTRDGRFFDPFRPAIEPDGFESVAELLASRAATLQAIRDAVHQAHHFVFTLGLTECWAESAAGYVYPMCPGTSAGEFDPARHHFRNLSYAEVLSDMQAVLGLLRTANPEICVLLTVSPVPLTATASGQHVLTATTYSKSVLRGVAGQLCDTDPCVDYFPSYEIITGIPFRSRFYADNLRSVTPKGVEFVMRSFFDCQSRAFGGAEPTMETTPAERPPRGKPEHKPSRRRQNSDDEVCEEEMLAAFAPVKKGKNAKGSRNHAQRIGIVGNSHIAALRHAIDSGIFKAPRLDIVFWGFPGRQFRKIRAQDGVLVPPDRQRALRVSGGQYTTLPPEEFTALLFVGCGFSSSSAIDWLKKHGDVDDETVLREFRDRLLQSHALTLMRSIVGNTGCRVMFIATPLLSEASQKRGTERADEPTLSKFNRLMGKVLEMEGIEFIPQPAATIADYTWTRSEYSKDGSGALSLARKKNVDEEGHQHMNAQYGREVLRSLRKIIRSPT